jgi:hypothetical protein
MATVQVPPALMAGVAAMPTTVDGQTEVANRLAQLTLAVLTVAFAPAHVAETNVPASPVVEF